MTDQDTRYAAVRSRDARFDGEFFFAVETTGIYCRPNCPAVTPKRHNVRFYPTAAAAHGAGFRARALGDPDVAPPGVDVPDTWRPWRSYALHHLIAAGEWELSS